MDQLSLADTLNQIPGYIGWKDKNFLFLGCNANNARVVQLQNPSDIIGLQDIDLVDQTKETAALHRQHDQLALTGKTIKTIHSSLLLSEQKTYFQTKKPLLRDNLIVGIIYHCVEFIDPNLVARIQEIDKRFSPLNILPLYYELEPNIHNNPFQFSIRELECIFCLLRGMSAKQIAEFINLSKRTVESYINNIKNKIGCHTKSELIASAIDKGYLNILPPQFVYRGSQIVKALEH